MSEAIFYPALPLGGAGDFEEIVFKYSYRHGNNNTSHDQVVASPTKGTPKFVFLYLSDAPCDSYNGDYTEWPYYPGSTVRVPFGAAIIIDFLDLSSLNTGHVFAPFQSLFANALIIEESRSATSVIVE